MERIDSDGRWVSDDDGVTWLLAEPSQAWLAAHSDQPEVQDSPDPLSVLLAGLATAPDATVSQAAKDAIAVIDGGS